MPRVDVYQALQFTGFQKGLNRNADSSRLEADELAVAQNVRLGPRGEVSKRSGYLRHDTNLTDEVEWLHPWRTPGGADFLIGVQSDGFIVHDDLLDGSFTNSGFNVGSQSVLQTYGVGIASATDKIYVSSKNIADVAAFDGAAWTAIPSIPKAKHLIHRHNRLFAINDFAKPSGIYFSELGTPEIFGSNVIDDMDPDDGYEVNAAVVFGDDLVMFKDQAVWKLSGRNPASFALYRIDQLRGSVSHKSIAQLRGRLLFFDRNSGVWAFDGATFELLSQPINDAMLASMDYDNAYKVASYVGEDRYYMAVPQAAGGFRTYVFFADSGGWTEYDTGFHDAIDYLNNRYQGVPNADGVWVADPDTATFPPSGVPLEGKFRTGWFLVAGPGTRSRIRRLEMTVKGPLSSQFTVRLYRDFDPDTAYITKTFTTGVNVLNFDDEERRITSDGWGNKIHAFQIEFETDALPFQLNDFVVFFTGGEQVRGPA